MQSILIMWVSSNKRSVDTPSYVSAICLLKSSYAMWYVWLQKKHELKTQIERILADEPTLCANSTTLASAADNTTTEKDAAVTPNGSCTFNVWIYVCHLVVLYIDLFLQIATWGCKTVHLTFLIWDLWLEILLSCCSLKKEWAFGLHMFQLIYTESKQHATLV